MTPIEDVVTHIIIVLLLGVSAAALVATVYIWTVYVRAAVRSRLFRDWAIISTLIVVSGLLTVGPAILALEGLPRIPYTGAVIGLALAIAFSVPVYLAVRVWIIRRRAARDTPPRRFPPPTEND